jgi:hypothetical protein
MSRAFRFLPRFRNLALGSIALGTVLLAVGAAGLDGGVQAAALLGGALGVLLGAGYLVSPTWRIVVHVDDEALEVTSGGDRRFRLPWPEVREVVASPATRTCFVDGGEPERSLLVPGDGAPAPYDIQDRAALYEEILRHVPPARVREVELLERA